MQTIKINDADVSTLFTPTGLAIEYNEISGGNEGYMIDGSYTADVLSLKRTVTATCMPLTPAEWARLKGALYASGHYCELYYYDPVEGYTTITAKHQISSGAAYRGEGADGNTRYTGFTISFIER